jgi:hypothetical protein
MGKIDLQQGLQEFIRETALPKRQYEKTVFEQQISFLSNSLTTLRNKQKEDYLIEKKIISDALNKM